MSNLAEVMAEILFRDTKRPGMCFLWGEDGLIYNYNNLDHYLRPFEQEAKRLYTSDVTLINYIIKHSMIEYRDGDLEYGDFYWDCGGQKD